MSPPDADAESLYRYHLVTERPFYCGLLFLECSAADRTRGLRSDKGYAQVGLHMELKLFYVTAVDSENVV